MLRTMRLAIGAAVAAIAATALVFTAGNAQAATFGSSDRWATWTNGGYTLYNNVWGTGYGAQSIWANSYSNWGVWANHPNTGGVKAYPNATQVASNKKVSAIGTREEQLQRDSADQRRRLHHRVRHLVVRQQARDHAVDEQVRRGRPAGYSADHGHRRRSHLERLQGLQRRQRGLLVPPYQQHQLRHCRRRGHLELDQVQGLVRRCHVGNVQFGYEITSSSGGKNFVTNSFSVSS